MLLSNNNDCDYLPCEKRRLFLRNLYSRGRIDFGLTRLRLSDCFDQMIEDYYKETYKALDFSRFHLDMPVLASFVVDNTPAGMSPIDNAIHIKNEGPLIQYRQYLGLIENALEQQNWQSLRSLLNNWEDVVNNVIAFDRSKIESVEVSILPMPTVSLSAEMTIPKRKIHLSFLKDLSSYAINGMKPIDSGAVPWKK